MRPKYEGDTQLHLAAAQYQLVLVKKLLKAGAAIGAVNRLGATALHYAADGLPGGAGWNPKAQVAVIKALVRAGADVNGLNKLGVAPLHRAVRCRCSAAVKALLEMGADPKLKNKRGSTPLDLATRTTGRGFSGSPEAKKEQALILKMLGKARR